VSSSTSSRRNASARVPSAVMRSTSASTVSSRVKASCGQRLLPRVGAPRQ
jgi:hypothetical protein